MNRALRRARAPGAASIHCLCHPIVPTAGLAALAGSPTGTVITPGDSADPSSAPSRRIRSVTSKP